LRKAPSKEEAELKADRRGNAELNMLMSANGQAYVPKQNRPSNKGKLTLNPQHTGNADFIRRITDALNL
jgi:hypothetical protein